ncbi:ABC transporter substrate-binding protein [Salmonella enterica]|nr:ABC transporter substrate-binding protein [Salmonella enterica]
MLTRGRIVFLFFLMVFPVRADNLCPAGGETVTVGVFVSPPFVMNKSGLYDGIAIDIWAEAAAQKGTDYRFKEFDSYSELLSALEKKEIGAAVTNISITEERAKRYDFSFPWYDSGLRLLTTRTPVVSTNSVLSKIYHSGYVMSYVWIGILIILATFLLTVFDRMFDRDFTRRWFDGMAESFYHIISLITTGKTSHKQLFGAVGRILAALWMLVGVGIIAYVTSSVTSVMTAMQFTDNITEIGDLTGRKVGARKGSVSADILKEKGLEIYPVNHIVDGIDRLSDGTIAAIVGDAPVLEYYVKQHPYSKVQVTGRLFHHDKFGFAFPRGSCLTRDISLGIIRQTESGRVSEIKSRYLDD